MKFNLGSGKSWAIAVLILVGTPLVQAQPKAVPSFMMPQPPPSEGMWYEGWFIRVTDPTLGRSFATITTSAVAKDVKIKLGEPTPGYAALVYGDAAYTKKTISIESFPELTYPRSEKDANGAEHFTWTAENVGYVSDRQVDLRFPSGEEVMIELGARKAWSASSDTWGPGGVSTYIPFMPLAWWVESLGTPVTYKLKLANGEIVEGSGHAHIEKNWGQIFPRSWMWVQATNSDNSGHLALAGGLVGFGPLEIKAFMIGYKTKTVDLEIRPDQGLFVGYDTEIDSCAGTFKIIAKNLRDRIEIRASADAGSFASVSIPTERGYQSGRGKESFSSSVEVRVYRDGTFVESQKFTGAALEFGADYMVCPPLR